MAQGEASSVAGATTGVAAGQTAVGAALPAAGGASAANRIPDRLALFLVAVLDGVLGLAVIAGTLGFAPALAAHIVLAAVLFAMIVAQARAGQDVTRLAIGFLGFIPAGPLAALGAAALPTAEAASVSRQAAAKATGREQVLQTERMDAWYERIARSTRVDATTRLCDAVSSGRAVGLLGAAPRSFAAVIDDGALTERQTALGLVARRFEPEYVPALTQALKSPEPVIRVQAAAVANKITPELRSRIDAVALAVGGRDLGVVDLADRIYELDALRASGLLDEADRARATILAERLKGTLASKCGDLQALTATASRQGRALALKAERIEQALIAERRYRDLRRLRRLSAVASRGRYRFRSGARAARVPLSSPPQQRRDATHVRAPSALIPGLRRRRATR